MFPVAKENKKNRGFVKRNIIISITVILAVALSVIIYFKNEDYFKSIKSLSTDTKNVKDIVRKEVEVGELFKAREKVQTELTKLSTLQRRSQYEQYLIDQIEEETGRVRKSVTAKTDTIFNSISTNKTINTNKPSIVDKLNQSRKKIDDALKAWNLTLSRINTKPTPSLNQLMNEARNNINQLQQYVRELDNLVDTLTPTNSGLTQDQIDSYSNTVNNALTEATQATATINTIIQNSQNATSTGVNTQTPTNNSGTNQNSNNNPVVTEDDIEEQEGVVEQAQEELEQAEEEQTNDQTVNWTNATSGPSLPNGGEDFVGEGDDEETIELIQGTNRE